VTIPARGGGFLFDTVFPIRNAPTTQEAQDMLTKAQVTALATNARALEAAQAAGNQDEVKKLLRGGELLLTTYRGAEVALESEHAHALAVARETGAAMRENGADEEAARKAAEAKVKEDEEARTKKAKEDEEARVRKAKEDEEARGGRKASGMEAVVESLRNDIATLRAERTLESLGIPADVLSAADLAGCATEAQRDKMISLAKRTTAVMPRLRLGGGAGAGGGAAREGGTGGNGGGSIRQRIAASGLPMTVRA
jgi:hypothetical protein